MLSMIFVVKNCTCSEIKWSCHAVNTKTLTQSTNSSDIRMIFIFLCDKDLPCLMNVTNTIPVKYVFRNITYDSFSNRSRLIIICFCYWIPCTTSKLPFNFSTCLIMYRYSPIKYTKPFIYLMKAALKASHSFTPCILKTREIC